MPKTASRKIGITEAARLLDRSPTIYDTDLVRDIDLLKQKFWSKVEVAGPDECWLWIGATNRTGPLAYGYLTLGYENTRRTTMGAHRISWEIHNSMSIPDGLMVLHRCDVPLCVNPNHHFLGDAGDNVRDCFSKGRHPGIKSLPAGDPRRPRGKNHPKAVLNEDLVRQLRTLHAFGVPIKRIARINDLPYQTTRKAVLKETWAHV